MARTILVLAACVLAVACGKKAGPFAPIVRIPAAVEMLAASRFGKDVYVTLTVPAENIDGSLPVDIARIDVYGYTGVVAPSRVLWPQLGTVVASIPVVAPLKAGETGTQPIPATSGAEGTESADGAVPGMPVTIRDELTMDKLIQGKVAPVNRRFKPLPAIDAVALPTALRRFYLAIPFSRRGRPGAPGAQAEFVLTALPDPPTDLRVSYTAAAIGLEWQPSGGMIGFLLDRAAPPEPLPFIPAPAPPGPPAATLVDTGVPPGPTVYNVYRERAPDPLVLTPVSDASWAATLPVPIHPAPLSATSVADEIAFGRQHCYFVRAQRGTVLSEPSPRACFVPVDVFPPATPAGLAAVASEGGISLIWEPNSELDVGGYLVLRAEPGDATLRQLNERPVTEARYRDATVQSGTRYTYAVVALDRQLPIANVSAVSARVEETAP